MDLKDIIFCTIASAGPWNRAGVIHSVKGDVVRKNFDYDYHVNKYVDLLISEKKLVIKEDLIYPTEVGDAAFRKLAEEYYYWLDNRF